jgi:hypothetical protein
LTPLDGDIFASAGADFDGTLDPNLRSSKLALVFRIGNIDYKKFRAFKEGNPDHLHIRNRNGGNNYDRSMGELNQLRGFTVTMPTPRDDVVV